MSSGAYKPENHGKPLITLKTDWRGLKFSDFGEKPYVQHDLPSLEGSGRKHNQINARTNDLERFTKLIIRKPGLKFQGNQALLQQADTINDLKKADSVWLTSSTKPLAEVIQISNLEVNLKKDHHLFRRCNKLFRDKYRMFSR